MPQAKRSLGLIYAVNTFGADHQSSEHDPYYEEGVGDFNLDRLKQIGLGSPQPAYSLTEEKVRFAYVTEVFYSMLDSAELCQFVWAPTWTLYDGKQTAEMINAVTGWDMTVDELMSVGYRRLNLFRVFNAREVLGRKDDRLPKKFFKELKGTGPTAGFALTHEEVDSAIDTYSSTTSEEGSAAHSLLSPCRRACGRTAPVCRTPSFPLPPRERVG